MPSSIIVTSSKNEQTTWENSRMDKSLRPPEIILGLPYSPKVDIWMLGCTVGFVLFSLNCSINLSFVTGVPYVDREATRFGGKGDRRQDHA